MRIRLKIKTKGTVCVCLGASQTVSNKHVLIMDEVDGMAGNEDRGGIQVLYYFLLLSKKKDCLRVVVNPFTIICLMCNACRR